MDRYELKRKLRGTRNFFLVGKYVLETADDWAEYLDSLLHGDCRIEERNGELLIIEERRLVDKIRGLKIEIWPKEHPPPHFHVKSEKVNASFRIDNCEKLNGTVNQKEYRIIKYWWQQAKPKLIDMWNETRPTECLVGKYKEST
jgi:hypothetical protein